MAATDTELFFELTHSQFVQAADSANRIKSPVFFADDVKPILLKLLREISPGEVEVVNLTGVTVQIAVGTPATVPSVITSATSSSVDADGFLPITLGFNVAAVQTALNNALEIYPTLEIRMIVGSTPQRYVTTCTIKQRLITGTLVDTPAPDIATSLGEVMSLMVPRDGSNSTHPCSAMIMVDEDDATKVYRIAVRAGQLHVDPLT